MRGLGAETGLGLLVLAVAGAFLFYVLGVGDVSTGPRGYVVMARFGQVGALGPGAAVRVAGVKVGTVARVTLDPKTYMAITRLDLDSTLSLPSDSTARISSDGLLGGAHVAITPGGAPDSLKAGGEIENTQGAVDLFGLIGQVMRPPPGPNAEAEPPEAGPSLPARAVR